MAKENSVYLGDGVYAYYNGYAVVLDLRAQDSTTEIFLEAETWENLKRFVEGQLSSS